MRNVICILALLCTVYALEQSVTDKLERLVNIEKVATEAVLNGQLLFKERTKQNLELKLNDLKTEASVDIHNAINEALEDVDRSIQKGREEGKNVDDCYYYARSNLETGNTNAIAGLETCIQNGHTAMEGPLANVESNIEAAKKLLIDLEAIIPSCYSINFVKMQACVVKDLVVSRSSLKRITNNAKEVTATATVTYAKTIIDVKGCITKNTSDIRTFNTDIVIHTDNCVRNAPVKPPSQA